MATTKLVVNQISQDKYFTILLNRALNQKDFKSHNSERELQSRNNSSSVKSGKQGRVKTVSAKTSLFGNDTPIK
jgi:hypothetical protein